MDTHLILSQFQIILNEDRVQDVILGPQRHLQRLLQHKIVASETGAQLEDPNADAFEEIRGENNELFEAVRYTREAVVDGENLQLISERSARQVDKLVQLLESPIFVHLRLQLLDPRPPAVRLAVLSLAEFPFGVRNGHVAPQYKAVSKRGAGSLKDGYHPLFAARQHTAPGTLSYGPCRRDLVVGTLP